MNSVFVFPGQGSQFVGMGKEVFDRFPELVAQADSCLGYSIKNLCLEDPNRVLSQTQYTQPALYTVNALTYLDRLKQDGKPDYLAGHSLGEYCALFAAGAFDFVTGLELVKKRGQLMSQAPKGAMAAILDIDQQTVTSILQSLPFENIDLANINSEKQCILSGIYEELMSEEVEKAFSNAGANFIPLNVSAAFHSRCMIDVQKEFSHFLAGYQFNTLQTPVVANCTARPYPKTNYTRYMETQISSSVRWYESISWLIQQGYTQFEEVGPGTVLTKLCDRIVQSPMVIKDAPEKRPAASHIPNTETVRQNDKDKGFVFMYAGQGSQYYQMGKELYQTHPIFKQAMQTCDQVYRAEYGGQSLLDIIYDENQRGAEFDNVLQTHPALFSIGYALTEVLKSEGFVPSAVLGHSLGEYIAATVAGCLDYTDALKIIIKQSQIMQDCHGGLMSILASPDLFHQRPDIFSRVSLAGINFKSNFFISGSESDLNDVYQQLDRQENVLVVRLPVKHPFHSPLMDKYKTTFLDTTRAYTLQPPSIKLFSSVYAQPIHANQTTHMGEYLWDVVRKPVKFDTLMSQRFVDPENYFFVDLSASGTFSTFLKYGKGEGFPCGFMINQFGNNNATLGKLLTQMREYCARPLEEV